MTNPGRALARKRWGKIEWRPTHCKECGGPMLAKSDDRQYCKLACKQRRYRRLKKERQS